MQKILFVAAEGLPFIKSGGLADVIGSLPKELSKKGYDTRVVLPLYQKIIDKYIDDLEKKFTFEVNIGATQTIASVYECTLDGVIFYFIEHQHYFERDEMYGHWDDGERFAFFSKSSLEMLQHIDYFPDVIHSHDWHTGVVSILCRTQYPHDERYKNIKHVYTIHNLAYQGNFGPDMLTSCLNLSMNYFYDGTLRFHSGISFMKAGIIYADKVTTVSPTYANEILDYSHGEGMDGVLHSRSGDLSGIVNGIDIDLWDPKTDKSLVRNYTSRALKSRLVNKEALQKKLGLEVDQKPLLIGMVTRLTWQKGIHLVIERIHEIMNRPVQLVILGSGDSTIENDLKNIEQTYPGKAVYYCDYNEDLAHQIYAGSDVFLMPSLFEPCGISQLISMRYGSLPIVRETGGLKDTVEPYNEFEKTGWGFSFTNFSGEDMIGTLDFVLKVYDRKDEWNALIKKAMKQDVSWEISGMKYIDLYSGI